jgi:hypothetical protein
MKPHPQSQCVHPRDKYFFFSEYVRFFGCPAAEWGLQA